MAEEIKKEELMEEEELSEDDLEQVSGGAGMRRAMKVKTQDISQDTMRKIGS